MPEVRQQATGPEALGICGFSARDFGEIPFPNRRLRHLWRPARSGRLLDELAGNYRGCRQAQYLSLLLLNDSVAATRAR
jgi:hypothetical protein